LHSAFNSYKTSEHQLSPNTIRFYKYDIASFLAFAGGSTPLEGISLEDYHEWMVAIAASKSDANRKFWALRYLLTFSTGSHPFGNFKPKRGAGWHTAPVPEDHRNKLLADRPKASHYYNLRAAAMVALAWDRFTLREMRWMILSDLNLEMGLVAVPRGMFTIGRATVRVLNEWLEIRTQLGPEPSLFTGKTGVPVVPSYLGSAFSDYTLHVTGTQYSVNNVVSARYLFDVKQPNQAQRWQWDLAHQWGKSVEFVASVLDYFKREKLI
jgi:site-specific recombinase XerC